jgi:hypothetical protein
LRIGLPHEPAPRLSYLRGAAYRQAIEEVTPGYLRERFATNLGPPPGFFAAQAVFLDMGRAGGGSIITSA